MYYSEFDSYLLFHLEEDPGEMHDRYLDPTCRKIGKTLLDKLKTRWSAERALEALARQKRRLRYIFESGMPICPKPFEHPKPAPDANEFDFSQLPGWPSIKEKAEKEWRELPELGG